MVTGCVCVAVEQRVSLEALLRDNGEWELFTPVNRLLNHSVCCYYTIIHKRPLWKLRGGGGGQGGRETRSCINSVKGVSTEEASWV